MNQTQSPETAAVDQELLLIFLQEAEGHFQAIRTLLPQLETGGADVVQTVRRAAHTLKGSAAVVGLRSLTRLAHRMEDLLDRMYAGLPPTPDMIDLLSVSTDRLEDLTNGQADETALRDLYARYDRLLGRIDDVESAAPGGERERAGVALPTATTAAAESFVRVPLRQLDALVRLVSELTGARSAFEERMTACTRHIEELRQSLECLNGTGGPSDAIQAAQVGEELARLNGDAEDLLGRQARLANEIHDRLMQVRLVPFGALAARLRRTVRQVAEQSGKRTDLKLQGEAVALDKAMLEDMAEPLMHLLRNAVDHGIEPVERRRARGKPECGRVTVRASHEGDRIVLYVSDDGGGVDLEAVRARAVERGFAAPQTAARLTEAELLALPFLPGFSTAAAVSETSGRGVGLDVVRACVERLKGSVTLTSRPGEGAAFVVRLPMTVAVMRALMVQAYGQTFALPLASVARVARVGGEAAVEPDGTIRIGEESYPGVVLGEALRLRRPETSEPGRAAVLLLKADEGRAAVIVDEVQGGREVVVKNLGTHLRKVHGVSGATLMGDGQVVLILNPAEFMTPPIRLPARPAVTRSLSVLIVDDSASLRRALTGLVQSVGWRARTAGDGREALEQLSAGSAPDVMLVDVDMPRMNGYEFLSAVKSQASYRCVPVVMVTSRGTIDDRRKAQDLGADGYVVKPFKDEELLAAVRALVSPDY